MWKKRRRLSLAGDSEKGEPLREKKDEGKSLSSEKKRKGGGGIIATKVLQRKGKPRPYRGKTGKK